MDAQAIWDNLTEKQKRRTSIENVQDVIEALEDVIEALEKQASPRVRDGVMSIQTVGFDDNDKK